jgi:hypothetical protein
LNSPISCNCHHSKQQNVDKEWKREGVGRGRVKDTGKGEYLINADENDTLYRSSVWGFGYILKFSVCQHRSVLPIVT